MGKYQFVFDLDATITSLEILPALSKSIECFDEVRLLTEMAMSGAIPFEQSFLKRVELLKSIPIDSARRICAEIPLNEEIVNFISQNRERCYIITGNLDVWIEELLEKLDMKDHCFSSSAIVKDNRIVSVSYIANKSMEIQKIYGSKIAIGDGSNDVPMIALADIGIGFGGVRAICREILQICKYAIYDEKELCDLLNLWV